MTDFLKGVGTKKVARDSLKMEVKLHLKKGNRVWSHTVSRPLSVSGACLAIFCDLTGKCVQLNWSSILLDGCKKLSLPRQPSREDSS